VHLESPKGPETLIESGILSHEEAAEGKGGNPEKSCLIRQPDGEQRDLEILAGMIDGKSYAKVIYEEHPELWKPARRQRTKNRIPPKIRTMRRIYGAIEKLLKTSKGARAYAWVSRIVDITGLSERTVRRYLQLVMKLVARDWCVKYVQGKGYIVSCPAWEAMKAQHGDLFDPPEPERMARSHWLTRDQREMVQRLRGIRSKGGGPLPKPAPHTPKGFYRGKSFYKRGKPRPRGRGPDRPKPAPPVIQKLARRILSGADAPDMPHCPRIHRRDQLAHWGAVNLLRHGYHRDDVGKAVRKALRALDTAVADNMAMGKGQEAYFWGILGKLREEIRRWKPSQLLADRRRFWEGELAESLAFEAEYPDLLKGGNPAAEECRRKLRAIARQEAALAAKKTAGKGGR